MKLISPLKTRVFWVLGALATLILFLAFLNLNRSYHATVEVLILAKGQVAASQISTITENAATVLESLQFYNGLLKSNEDIEDPVLELADARREEYWRKTIQVFKTGESSILHIAITNDSRFQAELIARQAGLDIATVFSRYYNAKNELDVRIVNGPISDYVIKYNPLALFALSVIIALILTTGAFWVADVFTWRISTEPEVVKPHPFSLAGLADFRSIAMTSEKPAPERTEKKSYAPENLPVADETSIFEQKEIREKSETQVKREATAEEIKERLNKLLRGEM